MRRAVGSDDGARKAETRSRSSCGAVRLGPLYDDGDSGP